MRMHALPRLNATTNLILEAYPTKVDIKPLGDGVYELMLHYLNCNDAIVAAKHLNAQPEESRVKLVTFIVFGGALIPSIQNTFSCQLVELFT